MTLGGQFRQICHKEREKRETSQPVKSEGWRRGSRDIDPASLVGSWGGSHVKLRPTYSEDPGGVSAGRFCFRADDVRAPFSAVDETKTVATSWEGRLRTGEGFVGTMADPSNSGVTVRDACRKWGHYDTSLPVPVNGVEIAGRLTDSPTAQQYILRIKNMDIACGLTAIRNQSELVNASDFNPVANSLYVKNALTYWRDLNWNGIVDLPDLNMVTWHLNHDCDTPNNNAGACP